MAEVMFLQLASQRFAVQRQMHRVARLGVGELEIQLRVGGQADTSPAKGDACRGQLAQVLPRIFGGGGAVVHGYLGA
jgi:hypothetical protein